MRYMTIIQHGRGRGMFALVDPEKRGTEDNKPVLIGDYIEAVVAKNYGERGTINTPHGRLPYRYYQLSISHSLIHELPELVRYSTAAVTVDQMLTTTHDGQFVRIKLVSVYRATKFTIQHPCYSHGRLHWYVMSVNGMLHGINGPRKVHH
jgi:hypothetical protein